MTSRLRSPLAMLRALDDARLSDERDVDARFAALYHAGCRHFRVQGCPTRSNHGHVLLSFRLPDGTPVASEGSTYRIALDRAEAIVLAALRSR